MKGNGTRKRLCVYADFVYYLFLFVYLASSICESCLTIYIIFIGVKQPIISCMRDAKEVSDKYCRKLNRPDESPLECNIQPCQAR